MKIQKLILDNFQKHEHLELNFQDGVNFIYGSSDAGKSCCRRALGWIFFNNISGDIIRKEGTKTTTVKVILDSGIEVTRIKSASINRIIIKRGEEEKTFDSIGRTYPEEVQQVLQVRELEIAGEKINLNIASQITLPFLLDKPATFRVKLFDTLTGNNLIDSLLQTFNKELLSISRDLKVENEFIEKNEPQLKDLEKTIDEKKNLYNELVLKMHQLKDNYNKYNRLQQISNKLDENTAMCQKCTEELQKYSKSIDATKLEEMKKKNEKLTTLKNVLQSLRTNKVALEAVRGSLAEIRIPSIDTTKLKGVVDRLARLKLSFSHLKDNSQLLSSKEEELANLEAKVLSTVEKYRELIKQAPICDKCKQIIKLECQVREI